MLKILQGIAVICVTLFLFAVSQRAKAEIQSGTMFLNAQVTFCTDEKSAETLAKAIGTPRLNAVGSQLAKQRKCGTYRGVYMVMEKVKVVNDVEIYKVSIPSGYIYTFNPVDKEEPKKKVET